MNKLIWFLLGALVATITVNRLYNEVTSTKGLVHFAKYAYVLGCLEAHGLNCKIKSETYSVKLEEVIGVIK